LKSIAHTSSKILGTYFGRKERSDKSLTLWVIRIDCTGSSRIAGHLNGIDIIHAKSILDVEKRLAEFWG